MPNIATAAKRGVGIGSFTIQTFDHVGHSVKGVVSDDIAEQVLRRRRAFGARVRKEREARKLSQERLAENAGLGRVTVVRMELGTQSTGLDHLYLIADALGISLSELVRDQPHPPD